MFQYTNFQFFPNKALEMLMMLIKILQNKQVYLIIEMKKFFVVFCAKNMHRPHIYTTLKTTKDKISNNAQLTYQQFSSQIEAEKFIYPRKMSYLYMEKQLKQKGISVTTMEKINQVNTQADITQSQSQIQATSTSQDIPGLVEQKMKKHLKKLQNGNQKISMPLKIETNELKSNEKENTNTQYKFSDLNFEELQIITKQTAASEITKNNIRKAYAQLLEYQGNPTAFIKSVPKVSIRSNNKYMAFFDGCSKNNPGPAGIGYYVMNASGKTIFQNYLNLGIRTNNQAQLSALAYCLLDCKHNGITKLKVYGDSQLAVNGAAGKYKIEAIPIKYINIINKYLSKTFEQFQITHVLREQNKQADKLSNQGLKRKPFSTTQFKYL